MAEERRKYWYEFFEWQCVLCMAERVEKRRVYDRPKPKEWRERHHIEEGACSDHFM